jgi:phospholipid/cholesterol/gamma-HCH transport system substrate-binding protein
MENKSHALAAGTFVLVLMALLVSMAVWLTRETRSLRTYELSSADAVTGLQVQAAVRFKGVNVGKVTDIGFDTQSPGNVLVRIAIDEQTPVTTATFATLGFQGVTGLAFIQLDDSGAAKAGLPAASSRPTRIPMRPGLLSRLSDQGASILLQLDETSRRVNLLLAPDNQTRLMGAIDGMGQAATSLKDFSNRADKLLPQLAQESSVTLKKLQATSERVGDSADEARASAAAFKRVTERMNEKGGTLDQLAQGVTTLAATGQTLNSSTLPKLNRAIDEASRTARSVTQVLDAVNDNPQSLIVGNGPQLPGPGETGFSSRTGRP